MRLPSTPSFARLAITLIALGGPLGPVLKADPPVDKRPTNRLDRETSPYLRQHAHNPVGWYPWGPEAFERARKENKLVYLSVGYSSCHWCHVMERQTFENAEVARQLNASFVCIKVDREERPEVDQIYQLAAQILLQGQPSGWPLSVFLTPDGKPIAASGMFLPPEDRVVDGQKYTGLKSLMRAVLDVQRDHPDELRKQSEQVARTVKLTLSRAARSAGPEPRGYLVTPAVDALKEGFDPEFGGFGNPTSGFRGSKFPSAPALAFLLKQSQRQKSTDLLGIVTRTLDHMARGGIYDQLGGGFHRYSTERTWTVPHFEKMLSDNAQLVELYARAFERTKDPLYHRVAQETIDFIGRELTAPDGGFYSALDADSDGEEGRFYLWTDADLHAALPDRADADFARAAFGIATAPTVEGKYFVLTRADRREPPDGRLTEIRKKLFTSRAGRPRPFLDTKIVTAWNGQMIAALAVAGQVFDRPQYTRLAGRAADFVLAHCRSADGRLLHCFAAVPGEAGKAILAGTLDDYVFFVDGLLTLHDATGEARWLSEARSLTDLMVRYHCGDGEGFYFTASDQDRLFARVKPLHDVAQPSGNSMAVRNLLRLAAKTNEGRYRELAAATLRACTGELEQNPGVMSSTAEAVDEFLNGPPTRASKPEPAGGNVRLVSGQPGGGGAKRSDSVVKAAATADKPDAIGRQTVRLKLTIDKGWHVYANPVGNEGLDSAQTSVTVSGSTKPKSVKVQYPKGKTIKDAIVGDYGVYDGTAEIVAMVERAAGDSGPLEVTVKLQACNEKTCLLPATIKLSVP
jgi:uncharacterized protein YyaL (SSP411 family)